MDFDDIIKRHERVALQFSGGKDSLACLYLLRPYWDRLTVYWCNNGDAFPETLALAAQVRALVPHFVEIGGDVQAVQSQCGIPSDVVPAVATPFGRMVGAPGVLIQDRYSCCFQSTMRPLHERMLADGITLIIRGQRNDEELKAPLRSGMVEAGIEYLFPVEGWSARQVLNYLREQDAPIPRFYEMLDAAPDCLHCSAYWETGAAAYLKRYHHDAYQEVQRRLNTISEAIAPSITAFNVEIGA